jgi:peroxiredoxin
VSRPILRRKLGLAIFAIGLVLFIVTRLYHPARHGSVRLSVTNNYSLPLVPDITLTDLSGRIFNTASLKGNVVIVNFWAAWCTPCTEEVPKFIALQQKYQNRGLEVIGISIDDDQSELRDFYRRSSMNYPVIAASQEIAQAYGGILGLPTTFIIGRDGRIQKKLTGATDFTAMEQEAVALLEEK